MITDTVLWVFVGMMFAWFIVPDPPAWVVWAKNLVWNKVKSWFETNSSI